MNKAQINKVEMSQKAVKSAIKTLLSKYDKAWYENELNVDQARMSAKDYSVYCSLDDARESLRRLANGK